MKAGGGGAGAGGCELAAVEVEGDLCVPSGCAGSGLGGRGVPQAGWGCCGEPDSPGSQAAGLYFLPFFPPPSAGRSEEKARQKAEPVPRRSCSDPKMALCAALIFRGWAVLESRETCQE